MISFLAYFSQFYIIYGLTCNEILELPESQKLTLAELQTVQPKDTVQCVAHLGREQLPKEEADYIWKSIVTFYSGIANVPDNVLMLLRWITPALTPNDYRNMTLNDIDVVQNFGLNYDLSDDQLTALAERVQEDFSSKEPEDYTYYDLTALGYILCAFNQSDIERIHPAAYREAALTIGKFHRCRAEAMQGFAALAVQPTAFGPPARWTDATIQILGKVAQFMPQDVISKFKINRS